MLMPSRIALTWLQVFALTLPGFPTPVRAQQSPLGRFIRQTRLDNGLDVIVVENHAVPLATVLVTVRNGAFTQEPAERGLAHLYEHVLFRSYKGDPRRHHPRSPEGDVQPLLRPQQRSAHCGRRRRD